MERFSSNSGEFDVVVDIASQFEEGVAFATVHGIEFGIGLDGATVDLGVGARVSLRLHKI